MAEEEWSAAAEYASGRWKRVFSRVEVFAMLIAAGVMPWDFDDFYCRHPEGGYTVLAGTAEAWGLRLKSRKRGRRKGESRLEATPRTETVGGFVKGMILETELSYDEIAAATREHFPGAKTNASCVSWYRSRLKAEGKIS